MTNMKLKDYDLIKDYKDFKEVFDSYNGLSSSSLNNADIIQWMMAVTSELDRLHGKINQCIVEIIELQDDCINSPAHKGEELEVGFKI